jgi:hypothetical protein
MQSSWRCVRVRASPVKTKMNLSDLSSGIARVEGRCEGRQLIIKNTFYNRQHTSARLRRRFLPP